MCRWPGLPISRAAWAADNLCGAHKRYRGTQGSAVLKLFDLTIATTGLNERAAGAARPAI